MLIAAAVLMLAAADPSDGWEACLDSETPYEDCERQDRERVIAEVGAQPLGEMEGDVLVRRAMFFDDYRRDQPLVEFRHDPGSPPRVIVSFDRLERGVARLEAPVSQEVWDEVLSQGRYFDRALGPEPARVGDQGEDDEVLQTICLHPRYAWVQAYDSDQGAREAGANTCADSLAVDYAYQLAELAGDLLPSCAALDRDKFGPSNYRLMSCFALSGDTLTAAAMMNDLEGDPFFYPDPEYDRAAIRRRFGYRSNVAIEWDGTHIQGWDETADWWLEQAGAEGSGVYELTHTGETWNRVRSRGVFVRSTEPEGCPYRLRFQAPIEIEWIRNGDFWQVTNMIVGAFSRLDDEEEC